MRRILYASNYVPAAVFFTFSAYYLFKMMLNVAPSSPLSWQLYLSISPLFSEASALLWRIDTLTAAAFTALLGTAGVFASRAKDWSRWRFIHFHAALLVVFAGMRQERVFSASLGDAPVSSGIPFGLPDFSRTEPAYVILFLAVLFACFMTHRSIIWSMRHPVRAVAPVCLSRQALP